MSKGILVTVLGILMAANSYASENSNCPNLSHEDRTLLSDGGVLPPEICSTKRYIDRNGDEQTEIF